MNDRRREVEDLRRQMAEADAEMVRALERRARLARQLGDARRAAPTLPAQERQPIEAIARQATELPAAAVEAVLRQAHAATVGLEGPSRAVVVGPEGGVADLAAHGQFGPMATYEPVEGVAEALEQVVRGRADHAVIPFESSTEGLFQSSIAALAATDLSVVAEVEASGALRLCGAGAGLASVEKVYATAIDRAACARYLAASLPRASVVDVRSPALAAQLAEGDAAGAAILPEGGPLAPGLHVLQGNIGDQPDLRLRFGIVAARPASRTGADTTALVFGVHDQPGALFDVLRHFADGGINLRTIQSRPMAGERWSYLFYVEVSGHVTDRSLVTALDAIKREARSVKVLGSFPASA